MFVFGHYPLGNQSDATEKEKLKIDWKKWEKSNGDCIFPSVLQCWRRRRKSFMVCIKGPAEKVGFLKQFMLFIPVMLMSAVSKY